MSEPRKVKIIREEWYPVFSVRGLLEPSAKAAPVIELTADERACCETALDAFDAMQAMLRAKLVAAENPSPG